MSYELTLIKLRPGLTITEAKKLVAQGYKDLAEAVHAEFMAGPTIEENIDDFEDDDFEEDEDLVESLHDRDYDFDALTALVARPWIRCMEEVYGIDDDETRAWIEGPEGVEPPDSFDPEYYGFEMQGSAGPVMLSFSFESLDEVMPRVWEFAKAVAPLGCYFFDEQAEDLLDPETDAEIFEEAQEDARNLYDSVMGQLTGPPQLDPELADILERAKALHEDGDHDAAEELFLEGRDRLVAQGGDKDLIGVFGTYLHEIAMEREDYEAAYLALAPAISPDGTEGHPFLLVLAGGTLFALDRMEEGKVLLGHAYLRGGESVFEMAYGDEVPEIVLAMAREAAEELEKGG